MYRTDLRIREVVKRFVSYIISSSLAFSFIVLLRDNEKIYSLTGYQDTRSEMKTEQALTIMPRTLIPAFAHNHNLLRLWPQSLAFRIKMCSSADYRAASFVRFRLTHCGSNDFKPQNIMFTIKIVWTFSNEGVSEIKEKFKNVCFGLKISRAPPSWIIGELNPWPNETQVIASRRKLSLAKTCTHLRYGDQTKRKLSTIRRKS